MTWEADNELVATFNERLVMHHGQYGPERGTVRVFVGGKLLHEGPESTLRLAQRNLVEPTKPATDVFPPGIAEWLMRSTMLRMERRA